MKASKQDFKEITEVINLNLLDTCSMSPACRTASKLTIDSLINNLKPVFERSNPNYNHDKFVEACWKGV